jgi:hypothetical protein
MTIKRLETALQRLNRDRFRTFSPDWRRTSPPPEGPLSAPWIEDLPNGWFRVHGNAHGPVEVRGRDAAATALDDLQRRRLGGLQPKRVIVCRVGAEAVIETIEDSITALEAVCGGPFDRWRIQRAPGLYLFAHRAALLDTLPPNRMCGELGLLRGDFLVSRMTDEDRDSVQDAELPLIECLFPRVIV